MCIVKCPGYFEENADGDAQVISGILADETDAVLKEVLSQCPVHAISLGENVDVKQSVQKELDKLQALTNGLVVKRDDVAFPESYCVVTTSRISAVADMNTEALPPLKVLVLVPLLQGHILRLTAKFLIA